jgi:hypothetical protein
MQALVRGQLRLGAGTRQLADELHLPTAKLAPERLQV